jgi:hypothetical protein
MPQITRTVNDLIINSLYLTGELGVGETPDAFMLTTGLELVNELLDKFSSDSIYIPYITTIEFPFIAGQGTYSVSDMGPADIVADRIVDLVYANYILSSTSSQPIIYPIKIINKSQFYNVTRLINLLTRPGFVFLDKQANDSFLTFYPAPDQAYQCIVQVKSMINELNAEDDLTPLPPYYYGFLKYALARKFLAYYPSSNWPQQNEDEYQDYYNNLKNANETDLTIRPSAVLDTYQPFYWPNITVY